MLRKRHGSIAVQRCPNAGSAQDEHRTSTKEQTYKLSVRVPFACCARAILSESRDCRLRSACHQAGRSTHGRLTQVPYTSVQAKFYFLVEARDLTLASGRTSSSVTQLARTAEGLASPEGRGGDTNVMYKETSKVIRPRPPARARFAAVEGHRLKNGCRLDIDVDGCSLNKWSNK